MNKIQPRQATCNKNFPLKPLPLAFLRIDTAPHMYFLNVAQFYNNSLKAPGPFAQIKIFKVHASLDIGSQSLSLRHFIHSYNMSFYILSE